MATIHSIDTIVSDESAHDGQPIIAGTRIRVTDMVASHIYRGLTPDELAINFKLNLGQVYAALAYYYQHKDQISDLMKREEAKAEKYLKKLEDDGKRL